MSDAFKHNGVQIQVTTKGTFTAIKNGEELSSTSLAGIKKKLDGKESFVVFTAIAEKWGAYGQVTVVGVKRARAKWRGDEWSLSNGETAFSVIEDTDENRALLEQIKAMRAEKAEHDAKYRRDMESLNEQIKTRKPNQATP